MQIIIRRFIPKEQEKTYLYLPFEVPSNTASIAIGYRYEGDDGGSLPNAEKNCIDLGVIAPDGSDLGGRGSSVHYAYISPSYSTDGFRTCDLRPGTYQVLLGAYLVRQEGVEVEITITVTPGSKSYFRGDTHIHTTRSDGVKKLWQIPRLLQKRRLQFGFITDHNQKLTDISLPQSRRALLIAGYEWTNYHGHVNFLGVDTPFDGTYAIDTPQELLRYCRQAKERGAMVSVNHPTCCYCPFRFDVEAFDFDGMEVWNGPMRINNLQAVELWDGLLQKGKKIVALGGSDYHRDYFVLKMLGAPCVEVETERLSADSILQAVKEGKVTIYDCPGRARLTLAAGEATTGDTVAWQQGMSVKAVAEKLKKGEILRLIANGQTIAERTAKRTGRVELSATVEERGYVRAEILYRKKGLSLLLHKLVMSVMIPSEAKLPVPPFLRAMTNPIYFD